MTAALATWANCWAVIGQQEDLIGRLALLRDRLTHYAQNLMTEANDYKVNHIKQVIKWERPKVVGDV